MSPPELPPLDAPRIVKPRRSRYKHLPIIVLTRDEAMVERSGELFPISELGKLLVVEDSSLLVSHNFGQHLELLVTLFEGNDSFQYKMSPRYRDSHIVNNEKLSRAQVMDAIVSLVGFPGHTHHPIDPIHFMRDLRRNLSAHELLDFARRVRAFCRDNDLPVKPSAGGIAAQLLRDPRFYPEPRRKVPRIINDTGRAQLPGNYYQLHGRTDRRYSATYIDMENAHHSLAEGIEFPCANSLHAYGNWHTPRDRFWCKPGERAFDVTVNAPGLLYARIQVPHVPAEHFPPPWALTGGTSDRWLYSNEIAALAEWGVTIVGLHSAFVADDTDPGLNRYARWAINTLRERPTDKFWLKPTLHAAYGVLATRPEVTEFGFRHAKNCESEYWPIGPALIPVMVRRSHGKIETPVVNVIHRGMIEAETRLAALRTARWLHSEGAEIICVYADSLFVVADHLPFLPRPWRVKEHLTGLRFQSATRFISTTMTRLPGLPRNLRTGDCLPTTPPNLIDSQR